MIEHTVNAFLMINREWLIYFGTEDFNTSSFYDDEDKDPVNRPCNTQEKEKCKITVYRAT